MCMVFSLLGDSPAPGFYMPTFRNNLFHLHRPMKMEQSVPKRRHIKSRRRGITQKKAYNTQKKWIRPFRPKTKSVFPVCANTFQLASGTSSRLQLKFDGSRWRTGWEVKGKLANAMGSQYSSHYHRTWSIQHYYRWCAHLGCQQSTELTPPSPGRFKWTRPFRRETKSDFCVCAITFQAQSNSLPTFRDNPSVPSSWVKNKPLTTGWIGRLKISVKKYHYSQRNSSEGRTSHPLRTRKLGIIRQLILVLMKRRCCVG